MSIPGNGHLPDHSSTSDSDAEPEGDYRPISGAASDSDSDPEADATVAHHRLGEASNGISTLDEEADVEEEDREADVEEEDREEGDVTTGEAAVRVFSEDERRRRAPLPAGAAARIVDAMRGVEFPGAPPPWAGSVLEDQWLDRLGSLRAGRPN